MTWLVLTDKTQKIHSVSEIYSDLDPKQHNLSLDPLSSTDFKLLDNNSTIPVMTSDDPNDVLFFNHNGEDTLSKFWNYYKSVMINKN